MRTMKHWALAAAAAAVLALAGCGGGGSSSSAPPAGLTAAELAEMHALSTAQTAAQSAATAADMAASDAESAVNAQMANMAADEASYAVALDAAKRARAAANDAAAANTAAQAAITLAEAEDYQAAAETAQMTAEVEKTKAEMYATMVHTAKTSADEAAQMAAATAAKTKEAESKLKAINTEGESDGSGGLGTPPTSSQVAGEYNLAIKYGETSITVEGATEAANEKFMQAMDLGGGTNMLTRTMDADDDGNVVQEVAIITTDIKAPKAVAFAKFQAADGMMPQTLDRTASGRASETDDDPFVALAVEAGDIGHVKSARFTAGTAATLTFDADDTATANTDESFTTEGTYNGAMGTYTCSGSTDCTVVLDADNKITAVTGGWIFTPSEGATSDQPDYDYLSYGFWLQKTEDADGVVTYDEVETFATAHGMSASSGTITGSASYKGGATGVYVHNDLSDGGGMVESRTAGHFTADASLMAYFGQTVEADTGGAGQIAPNMLNSLTGTIDNFILSGGEEQDWSVTLGVASSDTVLTGTSFSGTAKGGNGDGSLTGTFYGAADMQPDAVAGEFNADFSNGSVAGAFGANKQ